MAAPRNFLYPDHLNPFGSDEEDGINDEQQDYPKHLDPFGNDDGNAQTNGVASDDYDDSLNPFGDDETPVVSVVAQEKNLRNVDKGSKVAVDSIAEADENNPFDCDDEESESPPKSVDVPAIIHEQNTNDSKDNISSKAPPTQPDSLEPPKPLPRTKSLLKKEQASRKKQQQQQLQQQDSQPPSSLQLQSQMFRPSSSSSLSTSPAGTFQRRKNKPPAPPVPINFKRQVSGSLDAIENELNSIGDQLVIIDKESDICQETLKNESEISATNLSTTRSKYIELIKRKNSILRRQKELMYKKRELKLDQIYSDIEYDLRMIGNKQLSNRTPDDEAKEKELLKKLVEIVEEKNDIVENLSKDSTCDSQDITEALRRLNISEPLSRKSDNQQRQLAKLTSVASESCDKSSLTKFSKIATLLPKSGTIKKTIKNKRKRLFKKTSTDSQQVER